MADKFGQRRDMSDTYLTKKTTEALVQDIATPRITVSD